MKKINKIYNSSLFLLPFALFIGLGITKIIRTSGTDAWISVILGTIIGLGINLFITKLPSKESKITTLIYNFSLLLIGILSIIKLISSVYLDKTNTLFLMIPLILLLYYTSSKDEYTLFKTTSILSFLYFFLIIFAIGSLISSIEIDTFKPIMINPINKILYGAIEYALYSTAPLLVIPNLKEKYNYKVYLLSSLFLLILFVLVISSLGIELSQNYRYPEYMLFKNIAVLDFIENIENILFFIWIINIYTLTSHTSLNVKKIINKKGLILIFIIITLIINNYIINSYSNIEFILNNFDYILVILFIIFIIGKLLFEKNHNK